VKTIFRSRRWQFFIIFLSVFAGILLVLESTFQSLRTRDIRFYSEEPYTEKCFWDLVNSNEIRYWFLLFSRRLSLVAQIEKLIPARFEIKLTGWGSFGLEMYPMDPYFVISWKDQLWYVEEEGMIWRRSLGVNEILNVRPETESPIFEIGEGFPSPLSEESVKNEDQSIHRSLLPVTLLKKWKEVITALPWADTIQNVVLQNKGGDLCLMLRLRTDQGILSILLPSDTNRWPETVEALGKILPGFPDGYSNLDIDALYKDKIVVKEMPAHMEQVKKK
jgi:hypothetical protein